MPLRRPQSQAPGEAVGPPIPWPRLLVAALGLAFLAYGCLLAWKASSADLVLGVGAVLLLLAFLVPADWRKLTVGLPGGGSLEVERAEAAQEALRSLPHELQQEIVQAEALPELEAPAEAVANEGGDGDGVAAGQPEPAPAPPAEPAESPAERLARFLITQDAFATHETATRWLQLRLKRRVDLASSPTPVTCAVRKVGGGWAVGVPRLTGAGDPPRLFGTTTVARAGTWLEYQAVFPDFFMEAGADVEVEFPPGEYVVYWGTPTSTGGVHLLATDRFGWPPGA